MKTSTQLKSIAIFITSLLLSTLAHTATITWVGNFNNEWNQVENWNPMIVPTSHDEVIIPSSLTSEIIITGANASCKTLTYNGVGFNLQIDIGWEFIIAGDINISGNSKVYGLGGIEVIGNNDCYFNYSDSTKLALDHINIKSNANVFLTRSLYMPYGKVSIFSGGFITGGNEVVINSITLVEGISNRVLNIDNSEITTDVLSLSVLNGGSFYSTNSIVNNNLLIKTDGIVSFNIVNSGKKSTIATVFTNARINIVELNAKGDINLIGNTYYQSQVFSIISFNILESPSIVKLTTEPYVSGYYFYTIHSPAGCNGEVLFTDGAEVKYNQVRIHITGGASLPKASMANIHASGYLAVGEGMNIGNNTGIVFNQTTPITFYWVNGTGDWNDANHWSLTSGGPVSGCIPGLKDHVMFNNASGFGTNDTVYVSHHIFCNNLIADPSISNKPIITGEYGTAYTLNICGNTDLRGFSDFNVAYPIFFWNKTTIGIQTGTHQILDDLFFVNTGTCGLLDNLNCLDGQKNVYQLLGSFKTNGHEMKVSVFVSKGSKLAASKRSLSLSNSIIHIGHPTLSIGGVEIYSDSINLNAGTSLFTFDYLYSQSSQFKIEGGANLQFYNLQFLTKVGTPILNFNIKSAFNKVHFYGNGRILNANSSIVPDMSSIDTLVITGKFRYEFAQNTMINIRKKVIHLHSVCNEMSIIGSTSLSGKAYIYSNGGSGLVFENTWIENIEATGNNIPFAVTNGVDGGNNTNFNFISINPPQVFYWNGEANTSRWSEGNNWNIGVQPHAGNNNDLILYNTTGCIPGFNDSVVFHTNSFPVVDTVTISENVNFRGMMWLPGSGNGRYIGGNDQFNMNDYGGLSLDNNLTMLFGGELFFRSPFNRQLYFKEVIIQGVITFYNLGKYTLMDNLTCAGYSIQLLAGSFITSNYTINSNRFWIKHEFAPTFHPNIVDLGNSTINIANTFSSNLINHVSELIAENSTINLNGYGSTMSVSGDLPIIQYGHINYTSNNGYVGLTSYYYYGTGAPHFKHVNFEPSAYILGENSIDTLVLAEGKDYSLESNSTQSINDLLYSKGSPCYRTTITSTIPGTRAYIKNQNCNLLVEHARIRDIEGILGSCNANNYLVGVGGEDLGNNMNWNFIPGNPINGFGVDTILTCNTLPYLQTTLGFGRYESIVWSNGSTISQLLIDTVDTISATITYSPVCIVSDTRIFNFEDRMNQLAVVNSISCFGSNNGSIQLDIQDVDTNYAQTWIYPNNEIKENTIALSNLSAGIYTSIVTIPGFEDMCTDTATFIIGEPTLLSVILDTTIVGKCSDPDGIIMITSSGGSGEHSYLWNDESTAEDNYTASGGWNNVTVYDTNGCTKKLSVELACIDHINIPELITPNSDGFGDNWEIIDLYRLYPHNDLKIMNRWGNVVYHKQEYNDEFTGIPNTGDTFSIGYLPSGTYFYVIDLGKGYKTLTGYLELIY